MSATLPLVESWYREHHGWLAQWLRHKAGCSALAADLLQDTFLRLLRRHASSITHPEPRAYLCTIAKGLLVDHWRRQALEAAFLLELAQLPEAVQPSAEARLEMLQLLVKLDQQLDGLPTRVREAFLLSRIDGLSIDEIASQLKLSRSSIEKYLSRALLHCLSLQDD